MPTNLDSVVVDATDPRGLARFWADALGWRMRDESDGDVAVAPPDASKPEVLFVVDDDPSTGATRLHLDLASTSDDDQHAIVARLRALGATPNDVGQRDAPWVVLADPEGNAFCVLDPRAEYLDTGAVAAIVVAAHEPRAIGQFWSDATGWPIVREDDDRVALRRPDGVGPFLELIRREDLVPKTAKNRVHLDIAPQANGDHAAEVERQRALGATRVDIGQRDVTWVVLADPEGNELCVLAPAD